MTGKHTTSYFTLFFVSILFLSTGIAQQEYTRWSLPDGAIARLGKGSINEIEYSPNGKLIAVATMAGIWLYDAETTHELALMGGTTEVNTIAFSPDGKTLASGTNGGFHYAVGC